MGAMPHSVWMHVKVNNTTLNAHEIDDKNSFERRGIAYEQLRNRNKLQEMPELNADRFCINEMKVNSV